MKRDAAQTIFRTVVFAGAMLDAPACSKKSPPPAAPTNVAPAEAQPSNETGAQPMEKTDGATAMPDPCAGGEVDPCSGERPRGSDDDGGGGMGRGFILS